MPGSGGLSLSPLRGLRFTAGTERLGRLLCPPYDVIDADARAALVAGDQDNAVQIVLPVSDGGDPYLAAADTLDRWVDTGVVAVDTDETLYVYEMATAAGDVTRGLVGAVELRDPEDGVILPHENTMAGPVADRLALMDATNANLEPIYLVYDGGGPASQAVADAGNSPVVAEATTLDGVHHRLWAITDPRILADVAADLDRRSALIADGHHRYATYRRLAEQRRRQAGPGPWDRGLALLVDSSTYGPQVHAIHRVVPALAWPHALARTASGFQTDEAVDVASALDALSRVADDAFAVVVTDGRRAVTLTDPNADLIASVRRADDPPALLDLDVTVVHRLLVQRVWNLPDDEDHVLYAHDVSEALATAQRTGGVAVLMRPTPVAAVAAIAAAGARMPRKSTLFTPKPASGMVMRRFADAAHH
ncbi:MAG: DUF1015 domain-containing protein [bacterium]